MKIIAMLFLMVAPIHSQEKCQKENLKDWYYIYNTTVKININYCFNEVRDGLGCEKFNATQAIVTPDDAKQYCPIHNETKFKRVFCKFLGYLDLSNNTVRLATNTTCEYQKRHCNDTSMFRIVFWTYKNARSYALQRYEDKFEVWTVIKNGTRFIKNGNIGLMLMENIIFRGVKAWKTNYEGIIVSKEHLKKSVYRNHIDFKQHFKISRQLCETQDINTPKYLKPIPRMWYIYKYPIDLPVYVCQNSTSCEKRVPKNNSKLTSVCDKLNLTVCRKIYHVDLEDRCGDVQKAYESYEKKCGAKKCVHQKDSSAALILEREGTLCGQNVWYTNQNGLVASEKELEIIQLSRTTLRSPDRWDFSWFRPGPDSDSVETLGIEEYYLIVPLAICLLWILFKIVVSTVYLCRGCVKRNGPGLSEEIKLRRMRLDRNFQPINDQD